MSKVKVILVGFAVLGLLAGLSWQVLVKPQLAFADVATAYGAKKVCSCLYVGGREMESCAVDFTEDVGAVSFTDTGEGVTASVLGGRIAATARYEDGLGCRLVPERL